jgi:hypothetical protein
MRSITQLGLLALIAGAGAAWHFKAEDWGLPAPLELVGLQSSTTQGPVRGGPSGPVGVIVQPVGETFTADGKAFEARCRAGLPGFRLCYNGGSRPTGAPGGYQFFAFHPNTTAQAIPRGALNVSDTGGILSQLNQGGDVYGLANPAALEAYAGRQWKAGTDFVYYGFGHKKVDVEALKALERARK